MPIAKRLHSSSFHRQKFSALPKTQQHKKCCELLRALYELKGSQREQALADYTKLLDWLGDPIPFAMDQEGIADRFHWHLSQTSLSVREPDLLPDLRQGDRTEGAAPYAIAIYLDRIRSAHNIGSIVRTTEALRLGQLYLSPSCAPMNHPQVRAAAMGAEEWVECHQGTALESLPRPIIGLETSASALSLHDFLFPASCTLVVGNEEQGISQESLSLCDYLIEIPLRGRKNSLNVANAFAIVGAEVHRQYAMQP